MEITPDIVVYGRLGPLTLNATIVFTWLVMALLVLAARLAARDMARAEAGGAPRRWHNVLEAVVLFMDSQVRDLTRGDPPPWMLPLVGTLFLFIALSNLLGAVPGFRPPTGSLSTTAALALIVFAAAPVYGLSRAGLWGWMRGYVRPTPLLLPFNIMGDFTRTLALAVRLFGNIMSANMIGGILLVIAPILVPVPLQLLGLLTGLVQAYIFAVLAAVYVAAAADTDDNRHPKEH